MTKLPGNCHSLLSLYNVEQAVGSRISGSTAFIVGLPDKSIGRLAYLNCRYGLPATATAPGTSATPQIEIGVTLYASPSQAERRYNGTISDYVANGGAPAEVSAAGHPATILTGGGPGYQVPLLVATSGQRTVAVSLNQPSASPAQRTRILTALATLALTNTGS